MRRMLCWLLIAFGIFVTVNDSANAEEVTLDYLGLELNGNLEIASGKSLKTDGVVLLVHDTLAHHRVEVMAALQDSLRDVGINSLAITLGLGLDKRNGMFDCSIEQDHRHEDASDEISGWVNWLKTKGAGSVTVAGHGRGANQAALYAINRADRIVRRVVLISPLMQTPERAESEYRDRFQRSLREELAKAEELTANEEGNQLIDVPGFLTCSNAKITAGAFANYYGANPKFQTTNLLQSIKMPVLLAVGDADPIYNDIKAEQGSFSSLRNVSLSVLPGADHDLSGLATEEVARKIKDFVGTKVQG